MATVKNISVNGLDFSCPDGWTVEQARTEIRSYFGLEAGGLFENGILLLGSVVIASTTGTLTFSGGHSVRQGNCLFVWNLLKNILLMFDVYKFHLFNFF